jgi:hypothetical protein
MKTSTALEFKYFLAPIKRLSGVRKVLLLSNILTQILEPFEKETDDYLLGGSNHRYRVCNGLISEVIDSHSHERTRRSDFGSFETAHVNDRVFKFDEFTVWATGGTLVEIARVEKDKPVSYTWGIHGCRYSLGSPVIENLKLFMHETSEYLVPQLECISLMAWKVPGFASNRKELAHTAGKRH